jgi:hypothetical protein
MMKAYKNSVINALFAGIVCILMINACARPAKARDEAELTKYTMVPKHGLVQEKIKDKVKMQMFYRPTDLLVAQTLNDRSDNNEIKQSREQYGNYAYFILSISNEDKDALNTMSGSYQNFSENLQTLAFRMQDYLEMITSRHDTIPLADFHFPRLYGMGGATQMMLVFDCEKIKQSEWVRIRLKETGLGHGNQVFRFLVKDMIKAPEINF